MSGEQGPTPICKAGDDVVAIHKGQPFDAKILEIKVHKEELKYLIHFVGWNARYDERIVVGKEEGKIFKGTMEEYHAANGTTFDPATAPKAAKKKGGAAPKSVGRTAEAGSPAVAKGGVAGTPRGGKAKAKEEPVPVVEETPKPKQPPTKTPITPITKKPARKLLVPTTLRKIIVDDYELIGRGYIITLPAKKTIDDIVADYVRTIPVTNAELENVDSHIPHEENPEEMEQKNMSMVLCARGLVDYFNVVLGYQLLYKFERPQYNGLVQELAGENRLKMGTIVPTAEMGFRPSEHYGLIHLMRLVIDFERLLALSNWNDYLKRSILDGAHDFVKFLEKEYTKYYFEKGDYVSADASYCRQNFPALDKEKDEPSTSEKKTSKSTRINNH